MFELSVDGAATYSENEEGQALWGDVVFASRSSTSSNVTFQSGTAVSLRAQFANNGTFSDISPSFTSGDVVAISHNLSPSSNSVTYAIGHVREKAINYLGTARTGYYRAFYPSTLSAVSHFLDDYPAADAESREMDALVVEKAVAVAGTNYSDILTLTMRQVYGGSDLTIPEGNLDAGDIMVFLKEISSDGNVNTCEYTRERVLSSSCLIRGWWDVKC